MVHGFTLIFTQNNSGRNSAARHSSKKSGLVSLRRAYGLLHIEDIAFSLVLEQVAVNVEGDDDRLSPLMLLDKMPCSAARKTPTIQGKLQGRVAGGVVEFPP